MRRRPLAGLSAVVLLAAVPPALGALPQQSGSVDLLTQANLRIDGEGGSSSLVGVSVAGAGDVNGDGRDDLIIGAQRADNNGRLNSGSAYVVFGTSDATTIDLAALGSRGFRIDAAASGDYAGTSVAGAGDVDGDGRDDVIVGARGADNNGRLNSGSAYVVFGSGDTTTVDLANPGSRAFRIDGPVGSATGTAVAGAGDVDGDGRADVIVAAPQLDANGRSNSGSAFVVFGSGATTSIDLESLGSRGFRIDGATAGAGGSYYTLASISIAGMSVAGAGDIDRDGHGDVVVGMAEDDPAGRANAGAAYVVFGSAATDAIDLASLGAGGYRISGAADGAAAGISVGDAGDVNGDGCPDLVVGAPGSDENGRFNSGSAYVVFGSGDATAIDLASLGSRGFRIDGEASSDEFGISVAGAGDIDGDGRDDVVGGAIGADANGRVNAGAAYVVFGTAGTTTVDLAALGSAGLRINGAAISFRTGFSVAGGGDLNTDGRPDVVTGAYNANNNGRAASGSSYVTYGFGAPGLTYAPLRATVDRAIAPHLPEGVARTGTAGFAVAPPLPAGLTLDPFTGAITGTPAAAVTETAFTVTMSDLTGSVDVPLSLSVTEPQVPAGETAPAGPPPSPADTRAPRIELRVPARQGAGRGIVVRVRCDEDCRLASTAGAGAPRGSLADTAGEWRVLRIPLPARLARGRTPVVIRITATDAAGNRSTLRRQVLRRR